MCACEGEANVRVTVRVRGKGEKWSLCRGLLQMGYEVVAILLLLQSAKRHFGPRNVLFGVLEVGKERVLAPFDVLRLVCIRVAESLNRPCVPSKQPSRQLEFPRLHLPMQVGPNLVSGSLF